MALWRKENACGIGAEETSQDKDGEKPLHISGLTFHGTAGSAGPGEAMLHPTAYRQPPPLPIGESQHEKLERA